LQAHENGRKSDPATVATVVINNGVDHVDLPEPDLPPLMPGTPDGDAKAQFRSGQPVSWSGESLRGTEFEFAHIDLEEN
jgi:hypothetical protein